MPAPPFGGAGAVAHVAQRVGVAEAVAEGFGVADGEVVFFLDLLVAVGLGDAVAVAVAVAVALGVGLGPNEGGVVTGTSATAVFNESIAPSKLVTCTCSAAATVDALSAPPVMSEKKLPAAPV